VPHRVGAVRVACAVVLLSLLPAGALAAPRGAEAGAIEVGSKDGIELRRFLRDLVSATGKSEAAQPAALRTVFKKHPSVYRWVIEGRDLDQLIAEAGLESFQPAVMGDHGTEAYVDQRIAGMTSGDAGMTAMVQSALGGQSAMAAMRRLPLKRLPPDQVNAAAEAIIDGIPDSHWQKLGRDVDGAVADFKLTRTGAVAMLNDPDSRIEMPDLPPRQAARMNGLIQEYFDSIAVQDKRAMLVAMLALHPKASVVEQLAAVLHSAGPVAQKLFQLLGRNARSPLVRQVMNELKSSVKPFPDHVARKVVARNLKIDVDKEFSEFTRVGSASVGQVYRARQRSTGRLVAIKVLRPGIHAKAAREIETLRGLASATFEADLVETMARKVGEELDLVVEARNVDRGKVYNRKHSGIEVPERIREFRPTRDVLVMSFAEGSGLDRPVAGDSPLARGKNLERRGRALVRLLQTVMEEGLSSGIVHADLHGGNIHGSDWERGELKVAPIDWGSMVELSLHERRGFAGLALGVAARSPRQVVAALDQITPMSAAKQREVQAAVTPILRKDNSIDRRLVEVLGKAIEQEVRIPDGVTGFARTQTFLLGQIADVNKELDEVDPHGRLQRFRAVEAAGWAGYRVGTRDLLLHLANKISARGHAPARVIPGVDRQPLIDGGGLAQAMKRSALDVPGSRSHLAGDAARLGKETVSGLLKRRPKLPFLRKKPAPKVRAAR
jgi:predicted unusual protein kinase regulating ubiquinone biosynthesis (AarF/ABC1/UbiB family)